VSTLHQAHRGEKSSRVGVRGQRPQEFFFASGTMSHFWAVFGHMVFADGFLFPVKKLGLLTNPSHWVRVLDAAGSYMFIVL
jgi:hypothetical protein